MRRRSREWYSARDEVGTELHKCPSIRRLFAASPISRASPSRTKRSSASAAELNAILDFVAELTSVDVEGVEPLTSVLPMQMKKRKDVVTDGGFADAILANAPEKDDHYFVVPKVIE